MATEASKPIQPSVLETSQIPQGRPRRDCLPGAPTPTVPTQSDAPPRPIDIAAAVKNLRTCAETVKNTKLGSIKSGLAQLGLYEESAKKEKTAKKNYTLAVASFLGALGVTDEQAKTRLLDMVKLEATTPVSLIDVASRS